MEGGSPERMKMKPGVYFVLCWVGVAGAAPREQVEEPSETQVIIETRLGSMVVDLFPSAAPKHVEAFRRRVREGHYQRTTFHRAVPWGIIQGGDPLSRDPDNFELYGTGGLMELAPEVTELSHTRGAVSAVLIPGEPNSAGAQFFICVTDQIQLDGHYTVFGRVVEGMGVAETISQLETDANQRILERVEILRAFERERPPPERPPFEEATAQEMSEYRAVVRTNRGSIALDFFPDSAPEHVRRFLRLAKLGLYDGTRFHRLVPGFVLQGGSMSTRAEPVPEEHRRHLTPLRAEFGRRKHVRGTLSMARGDDPDSGMDSFFITLEDQASLDGKYSVFGQVVDGWGTIEAIELSPLAGEAPVQPVSIERIELIRKP